MNIESKISIGLVDDQSLFRKGMHSILSGCADMKVILEASNGKELLELLENHNDLPNILLLDLEMPVMNGVKTLSAMQSNGQIVKTIILSVHNEPTYVARMVELGASGYLQKNAEPEEVIRTIRIVHDLGFFLNESMMLAMRKGLTQPHSRITLSIIESLTKRELEILVLICQQKSTNQIAEALFISQRTVEGHRLNLLQKTDSRNSAGLAVFAIRHKLFNPLMDS